MNSLSIGEVARQSGLGIETVRFYEREGLLAKPSRKASGYRQYDENAVRLLRSIRRAKQLGFTLKEIKSLLALRDTDSATRADVREQARAKLVDLDEKIRDLSNMRAALQKLVDTCHGDGAATTCPILEALDDKFHNQSLSGVCHDTDQVHDQPKLPKLRGQGKATAGRGSKH